MEISDVLWFRALGVFEGVYWNRGVRYFLLLLVWSWRKKKRAEEGKGTGIDGLLGS